MSINKTPIKKEMPFTQIEHIHATATDVIELLLKTENLTAADIDNLIFLMEVIDIFFDLLTKLN